MTSVSPALRRVVAERAHQQCEYCGIPEGITLMPHEPDHVIGEQHGGETSLENLAYACFRCNRFKGPNIATLDPTTRAMVPLFNPRTERWSTHFVLRAATIEPLSASGRGTAALLRFNDEERVALRNELLRQGRFSVPPSR